MTTVLKDIHRFEQGINTKVAVNNVNDTTPTSAECVTAFGSAASVGRGFVGMIRDADADTNCFLVLSNGTSYYFLKFTKTA